jgi:hypothetical protein
MMEAVSTSETSVNLYHTTGPAFQKTVTSLHAYTNYIFICDISCTPNVMVIPPDTLLPKLYWVKFLQLPEGLYLHPGITRRRSVIWNVIRQSHICTKLNHKQILLVYHTLPTLSPDTRVKLTLVARPLLALVAQWLFSCQYGVFTIRTCVTFRVYFALKSFAAVHEAFSNVYPDKEVLNKTTVHWLITKFHDTSHACLWQELIDDKAADIVSVPTSSSFHKLQ